MRYVKLMDRGYGVPSTAVAYGLGLERKSINGALVDALNRGLLVEPRPGVYRLPEKG